jgi:tetratricopeptide (TPR) repeat protein
LPLIDQYRAKALGYEQSGDVRKSLQSWEIVSGLRPHDEEAAKKVMEIRAQTISIADQHFNKGLSYYQRNSMQAARKEFLTALQYNPDHEGALDYLKHKMAGETFTSYEVRSGDTLKEIAKRVYKDPQKDFLIAYFNDLGKEQNPAPRTVLRIPILDLTPAKPAVEAEEILTDTKGIAGVDEMLTKAQASFKARQYKESVSFAEKVFDYDPHNKAARDIVNASYYQMGIMLVQEKKLQEALAMFSLVEPNYRNVGETITSTKKQLAKEHYATGVKYYVNQDLDKAINEWEATLALDPDHPKARNDIQNARALLRRLGEIK